VNTTGSLIPYGRKSSGEDDELSHARQRGAWERWADANGVELAPEVWESNVSGSKRWQDRGLGEALAAVERGEAAGIIVEEQSRLSRENGLATAEVWDAFQRLDARLVCTAEGIDTATGDHELSFSIRAALAREQWKQYARRMADVKSNRTARGIHIARTPVGYVKNPSTKRLEIDPTEAPVVRAAFEARADGASWEAVARILDEGTGRTWSRRGAGKVIARRVYVGEVTNGDLVTPGAHEAIVDEALWQAAQRRDKEPARSGRKSDRHLLAGLVRCAKCGGSMSVWYGKKEPKYGTPQRRYRCGTRGCSRPMVSVNAEPLERWTVETLWLLLGSKVAGDEPEAINLRPLEAAVEKAATRLEQVMAPEARDALGDLWAADVKARRLEHEAAVTALGEARAQARQTDATPELVDLRERWDDMTTGEQREALSQYLVEAVVVSGTKPADWELVLR
jgi:DNA invertase Pin-like site-specific DNA recombinase